MIRSAEINDILKINELGNLITKNFSNVNNIIEDMKDNVKKVFVFTEEENLIGFISLNVMENEMEILDIVVEEIHRKKHIASKMLNYVFSNYKMKCFLEVNVNNFAAIKLYEKFNFKIINVRHKYYNNVDDAFVMKRGVE